MGAKEPACHFVPTPRGGAVSVLAAQEAEVQPRLSLARGRGRRVLPTQKLYHQRLGPDTLPLVTSRTNYKFSSCVGHITDILTKNIKINKKVHLNMGILCWRLVCD